MHQPKEKFGLQTCMPANTVFGEALAQLPTRALISGCISDKDQEYLACLGLPAHLSFSLRERWKHEYEKHRTKLVGPPL